MKLDTYDRYYFYILLIAAALAVLAGIGGGIVGFTDVSAEAVNNLLTPLLLIALFIERAVEVLITSWREPDRADIANYVKLAREGGDEAQIFKVEKELVNYQGETARYAFLSAMALSLFIAVCGVRVIEPLTNVAEVEQTWQASLFGFPVQAIGFRVVDIFLTAGMLAGGANGIHKVLSLFLDFVDRSKDRINATPPATPPPAA